MGYYAYEDQVARDLRDVIRTLQLSQKNLEIRREAVWSAAVQIELNQEIRNLGQASSQASGPTATRDAVSALSDLLTAQNDFLSIWVTYEVLRRTLDFNLGTMQLDATGMWVDPGPMNPDAATPASATVPSAGPARWSCREASRSLRTARCLASKPKRFPHRREGDNPAGDAPSQPET